MIVVAGEALIDLLVDPSGSLDHRAGGGPFNTARTIGRLGGEVAFLGRLSADRFGSAMREQLAADGVALACPEPVDAPTTLAVAELDAAGHARYRFHVEGTSAPALTPADLARARALLGEGGRPALHVGTLGLVLEPIATTLTAFVGELPPETLLVVDPNCRPALIADVAAYRRRLDAVLARADVVKVSDEDLGVLRPGVAPLEAARAIRDLGPNVVLLTAGARPAVALTASGPLEVPVPSVAVVDTVGAGDAFGGGFLAWWTARGLGRSDLADPDLVREAVAVAVAVSALTCERAGASPPNLIELAARGIAWPGARA